MKFKIIFLLFLSLQFFACQEQVFDTGGQMEGMYTFNLESAELVNEVDGELIQTRSVISSSVSGYLFQNGVCERILSGTELEYVPESGKIQLQVEGRNARTLYIVASQSPTTEITDVTLGMSEESFLLSATESTDFLTGKVILDPLNSKPQTIKLERLNAKIKLSRSTVFNIERIEIRHLAGRSYYFSQTPFAVPSDTLSRIYTASDIQANNLDITLPSVPESENVKITVYGSIYSLKVSLDFNLAQLKRNTQYELKLESPDINPQNRKFMVMAVCGESNAVGFDESPYDLTGEEAPVPHLYQLGMRTSRDRDYRNNLKVIPMDFCPQDMYDMRSRFGGTKKPHFPLGKELLKRIPEGYEVLIIDVTRPSSCVTYEGCRAMMGGAFATAAHNNGLGFYDSERMLPANLNAVYYWNKEGAFYKMLVDRVKYALSLNPENKFLGVMWIQGEDDENPSWVQKHSVEFGKLTTAFFENLNHAGYGSRCPRGSADKHLWYSVATTQYWVRFHLDTFTDWKVWGYGNGQSLFGYYKLWNPDTFVRPPSTLEYTNATNGTGATAPIRPSHYGNGAYSKVVCPMLVECMDRNGGLFNGKEPQNDSYVNKATREELGKIAGHITDSDVQDSLLIALPFDSPGDITKNLARNKTGVAIYNNGLQVSASAFGLPTSETGTRSGNTLKMSRTNNKNVQITLTNKNASTGWSATCLVRRTANQGESQQMIFGNGQNNKGPYMAFRITSTNEKCGNYTEFLASPAMVNKREITLPGSLHNANKVRSYDEWIHYGVIYDAASRNMRIFMNGEEVEQYTFGTTHLFETLLTTPLYLGSMDAGNLGIDGEIAEFFFWNKPITDAVFQKIYARSYWGYEN